LGGSPSRRGWGVASPREGGARDRAVSEIPWVVLLLTSYAFALPLLVERFDSTELPDGWKIAVFSQTGGGPQSAVAVDSGAVRFTAEAKTKRFVATSRKFLLQDVRWLRVSARVKTDGVTTTGPICGMFVRFENEEAQPAAGCPAGGEWKSYVRTFAVPAEAHDVEVGMTLTGAGKAWVDDVIIEPVTPDWRDVGKGNFTYHWFSADTPREEQFTANEEDYDRFVAFYATQRAVRVDMWKYPNLDAIEEYTGVRAESVVIGNAIHSIYRTGDRHLARLLGAAWGDPTAFVAHGLSVHLDGEWLGREIKGTARSLVGKGEAPALPELLDPVKFAAANPDRAYPVAGAFFEWVVATKGVEGAKALYTTVKATNTVDANKKAVETVFGKDLAAVEAEWKAWL
jgi:hypothetical protein